MKQRFDFKQVNYAHKVFQLRQEVDWKHKWLEFKSLLSLSIEFRRQRDSVNFNNTRAQRNFVYSFVASYNFTEKIVEYLA